MCNDPTLADLGHIAEAFKLEVNRQTACDAERMVRLAGAIADEDVMRSMALGNRPNPPIAEMHILGADITAGILERAESTDIIHAWMAAAGFRRDHAPLLTLVPAPKLAQFCATLG